MKKKWMKQMLITTFGVLLTMLMVGCGSREESVSDATVVVESNEEKGEEEKNNQTSVEVETKEVEVSKEEITDEGADELEPTSIPQSEDDMDELEKLETLVIKDVEDTISALNEEYGLLLNEVDTYEKYLENTEKIEAFYEKVYNENLNLCIRMREYSVDFAEMILDSGKSFDDMYDDLEIIYNCVYDDAGDDIYDGIYDGILDDMYDDYYDGILDDAYEKAEYGEWLDARSEEYEWWLDCRSNVYEEWLDFRSEVYEFFLDVRSEIFSDDIEKAYEEIEDFVEDIEKLK